MQDINQNLQSDYNDALERIQASSEYQQTMSFEQQKENNRGELAREKAILEQQKLQAQKDMKNVDLQIARENKNRFDVKKSSESKN